MTREDAVRAGRLLGEDECRRRGLEGEEAADVVERAVAYAVWDWEGRPVLGEPSRGRGEVAIWKPTKK